MKNKIFYILSFLLLINISSHAEFINYNWFFGIENIGNNPYFIINLNPEINYKAFSIKFDIPIEITTNGDLNKNHWNNNEDIITKIDFIKVTNKYFSSYIKTLKNISLGNGELVYFYSNDLFYPLLIKKGFSSSLFLNNFYFTFIIDDLNDYDLFFSEIFYKIRSLKTGLIFAYDSDIFDHYSEKPIDKNTAISFLNYYINYKLINKKKWYLNFENDAVKNIKSYNYKENFYGATGLKFNYNNNLCLKSKMKIYQKNIPGKIYFNKFYEIERSDFYNITTMNSLGVSSSIMVNFSKFMEFMLFMEKVKNFKPHSIFKIKTLSSFPTKINLIFEIYNKDVREWYHVFFERERKTVFIFKSSINLSLHLSLNFDYLKSFRYENNCLRGLHQTLFYSKFSF